MLKSDGGKDHEQDRNQQTMCGNRPAQDPVHGICLFRMPFLLLAFSIKKTDHFLGSQFSLPFGQCHYLNDIALAGGYFFVHAGCGLVPAIAGDMNAFTSWGAEPSARSAG